MNGTIHLLLFRLDDRLYGVRLSHVQRVIRAVDVLPLPNAPDIVLGAINLHGRIVVVLNIRKRFGLIEKEIRAGDEFIVARTSTLTVALVVDSVTEVVERPAEDVIAAGKFLSQLKEIEGVIQLEGGLALIHDLDRFLSLEERTQIATSRDEAAGHEQ